MSNKVAIYAGSFDPPTLGHLWVIEQGARLFDKLIIAVGTNPDKKYTFDARERVILLQKITTDLENVEVDYFPNSFLTDYARFKKASFILRGIRNEADYRYETDMRYNNADFAPEISTVFVTPPRELCQVSSSFVKNLIGPVKWQEKVYRYVPKEVFRELLTKFNDGNK